MKLSTLIARKFKEASPDGISSYALKYENGVIKYHINDVCFARAVRDQWWENDQKRGKGNIVEVAMSLHNAKHKDRGVDIKKLQKYTSFILNRSFFKNVFKTKSNAQAWKTGVDIDVDVNHSLCVAGMIALREGWEFPKFMENWNMLVKEGFDENLSYIVARMFTVEKEKVYRSNWGGHQTLQYITLDNIKKLIEEGCALQGESFRNSVGHYSIYKTLRSDYTFNIPPNERSLCISDRVFNKALQKKEGKGWGDVFYFDKKEFLDNLRVIEKEVMA